MILHRAEAACPDYFCVPDVGLVMNPLRQWVMGFIVNNKNDMATVRRFQLLLNRSAAMKPRVLQTKTSLC